ncbi:MAG TPA: hypothetical protein PLG50_02405 [bacterium]|nr:hypothetical protein [bacterium]HQG44496.1 hypothetical protein [bacterium]HQI47791.1 hypothetical protein [bacterium]HQJ65414.1 hypothetical protein [bacterium]
MKRLWIKIGPWLLELAKWGAVIYLLLPLRNAGEEAVDFSRVVLGILLFILFSGKMFYDAILDQYKRRKATSAGGEIIAMIGMVVVMAIVVGLVVVSIGLTVFYYLQQGDTP